MPRKPRLVAALAGRHFTLSLAMHLRCPHCKVGIEIVEPGQPAEVACPSCGSKIHVRGVDTATFVAAPKRQSIGRFVLVEWLGEGKFGEVWLAKDPNLDRLVAIKFPRKKDLDDDEIEFFLRGAQAQAQLNHPNIVKVHDAQRDRDTVYIVTDFVRGVGLDVWLEGQKPVSQKAAELCSMVARAIDHAHQRGVIHRDLKPANIMLDERELPLVLDFGLAKRVQAEFTIAVDGAVLGTPAYMPPEQARGEAQNADARSDVYSLGVILYEMLTGQRPFKGGPRLLLHQILNDEPKRPRKLKRDIPPDLETICLRAMEKDPARRYASAAAMADDLDCYLAGKPIQARPISRSERLVRWTRRNPALAAALGTILVMLVAGGGVTWRQMSHLREEYWRSHRLVHLDTVPSGARVIFVPVDAETRDYHPKNAVRAKGVTPLSNIVLPPGEYLVVAVISGRGFHEVYRTVPQREDEKPNLNYQHVQWIQLDDGAIRLPPIKILEESEAIKDMVLIEGGTFEMGAEIFAKGESTSDGVRRQVEVKSFYISPTEVIQREYVKQFKNLPTALSDNPSAVDDTFPVTFVTYDQALEYAERVGRRLIREAEYVYAATHGGRQRFPWGNNPPPETPWQIQSVEAATHDVTSTQVPVRGLYSNALEWIDATWWQATDTFREPDLALINSVGRIIHGGPPAIVRGNPPAPGEWSLGPRGRFAEVKNQGYPGVGFRCVRSAQPQFE